MKQFLLIPAFLSLPLLFASSCHGQPATASARGNKPQTQPNPFAPVPKHYAYFYWKGFAPKAGPEFQVSEYIRRIFQDKKGYLWFGTNSDGIVRYDGKEFRYFSVKDGLAGTQVTGIIEDKKGNLWFSTNGGITKYDGVSFTTFREKEGLSDRMVWSIFEDSKGHIWVGTAKGLCRLEGAAFRLFPVQGHATNTIWCITEDEKGNLWFGVDGVGVCKYDGRNFNFLSPQGSPGDNRIVSILADSKGNLWFGSMEGGLSRYDGNSFTHFTTNTGIGNNEVWAAYEDRTGNIWFSSEGFGVYRYDGKTLTNYYKNEGLHIPAVQAIYQDRQGRLWIGGGGGLYRMLRNEFYNVTKNGGPSDGCCPGTRGQATHSIFCSKQCYLWGFCGSSSPGRATASQAVGSEFESRLPLKKETGVVIQIAMPVSFGYSVF